MQERTDLHRRGILGIIMMVVPIVSIVAVAIGYAVLMWFGLSEQTADGRRTTARFESCPEARPLIAARVKAMGLEDATFGDVEGGFTVTATFPSADRVRTALPGTLAAPGTFAVRRLAEDGTLTDDPPLLTHDDIADVTLYMAFLDSPRARVQLDPAGTETLRSWMESHQEEGVALFVDGEKATTRANRPATADGALDVDKDGASDLVRMDFAAASAITLQHGPLPCEVTVAEVTRSD